MATITATGVGSGIDVNSLVSDLVAARREPQEERLDRTEAELQARLSGYGSIQGAISELQSALNGLQAGTAAGANRVEVGDPSVLSARAGSGITGSHHIRFDAQATAHRLVSPPTADPLGSADAVLGTGTLTFRFGTTTGDGGYRFTPDETGEAHTVTIRDGSLRGIAEAINGANIGVEASVIFDGTSYRLALASAETGAARSMQVVAADDGAAEGPGLSLLAFHDEEQRMVQTRAASDVSGLEIDGIPVSSASNTLSGFLAGIEIELGRPGETTLDLTRDDDAFVEAIQTFAERYNALVKVLNDLSSYDPETGEAGDLNGDSLLRNVQSQVRQVMGQLLGEGAGSFRHLSEIGLSHGSPTGPLDGTLVLDEDRLRAAIGQDPAGVAALFAAPGGEDGEPPGYAVGLNQVLSGLLGRDGPFRSMSESINDRLEGLGNERLRLDERMAAYEAMTRAKFNAMDALVAQLQSTGNFLTQQLEALPPIGQRR